MSKKQPKTVPEQRNTESLEKSFVSGFSLKADPLGSYTGRPKDPDGVPQQDADDL